MTRGAAIILGGLLFSAPAFASLLDPFTHPTLPFCDALPHKQLPVECVDRVPPDDLASILPIASKLTKDEQIRKMRDYAHKRMQEELDTTIESRKKLLACLRDQTAECKERVSTTRRMLEENLKRLRLALALSQYNQTIQDHSINPWIKYPASFGAGNLPRLSDKEWQFAIAFQKASVSAMEKIGIAKIKRELGLKVTDEQFREKCRVYAYEL